jgi:tetratricopeptide (TPR) repeat protein
MAEPCGERYEIGHAHFLLGETSGETHPDQAAAHFDKSIAILQEIKAENALAMAYAGYGRLHKQQGNAEQGREYLTDALEIFERLGTLIEPDKVREELAALPQ